MCAGVYVLVNVHMHALGVCICVCMYVCTYIITISTQVFTHYPRRVKTSFIPWQKLEITYLA